MVSPLQSTPLLVVIDIIIAIVVFVVLLNIVTSAQAAAEKQKAHANIIKLKSAIESVCTTGGEVEVNDFELPQTTRFGFLGKLGWISEANINAKGDPNHVLYYESFPPPEAISWELYLDLSERTVQYPQGGQATSYGGILGNVLLNNVPKSTSVEPELKGTLKGDAGRWDENIYRFAGYSLFDKEWKTAIKYRLCGINALCYKTPDGIRKLKLDDKCPDLEYIRLDGLDSNFHIVSPCESLILKVRECTIDPVCDKHIEVNLLKTNNDELVNILDNDGNPETKPICLDKINNAEGNVYSPGPGPDECIEIQPIDVYGCFTTDDWKEKYPSQYESGHPKKITLPSTKQYDKPAIIDYLQKLLSTGIHVKWRFSS